MHPALSAKDRIIEAAEVVFYQHGIRATGLEYIADASGITKATLYHHFKNKAELVEETLRRASAKHREECIDIWESVKTPQQKLVAMFDAMRSYFLHMDFYGCPYINAASEFSDSAHNIRRICEDHYAFIRDQLTLFARDANLSMPSTVAESLVSLIMGAYSAWYVARNPNAAMQAKEMALLIIAKHVRAKPL